MRALHAAEVIAQTTSPIERISSSALLLLPRNFGIEPTGKFLIAANQNTNNIGVFRIDQKTGKLTQRARIWKWVRRCACASCR